MKSRICLVLVLAIGALVPALQGCYELGLPPPRSGSVAVSPKGAQVSVNFTDEDRRVIYDYYAQSESAASWGKEKKTPPGLAKKETLPPGLQKRLERGEKLPPGLQGRGLPGDLASRLHPLPAGYSRMTVGPDILIWNTALGVVADIIHDVVTR